MTTKAIGDTSIVIQRSILSRGSSEGDDDMLLAAEMHRSLIRCPKLVALKSPNGPEYQLGAVT